MTAEDVATATRTDTPSLFRLLRALAAVDVIEGAQPAVQASQVAARCELAGGDFFQSVPEGGDAIIMKWIIHDWNDEQSIAIMKNCHRALPENGKLILI